MEPTPTLWSRCGWCNGYLTPSSNVANCPHPGALEGAPPRPRTPPVVFDALPPPSPGRRHPYYHDQSRQ
jgi:hypothetical protein